MITEQRRREIAAAFDLSLKQDNREKIEQFGLSELRDADAMLEHEHISAGYRIALVRRINALEIEENRKIERKRRTLDYMMWIVGLLVVGLVAWLFR